MVGAVLTRDGQVIGRGWHHQAGAPHAEIEALRDARARGLSPRGAVLYVTLEPCCTHGRTPPCTTAIIGAGIKKVVASATDPNPAHAGRGFEILRAAGVKVVAGALAARAEALNESFNHWIVRRLPLVTLKAAMTLDGKIATASGESKWITGPAARAEGMKLRRLHDGILAGVETVLRDDPSLTWRPAADRRPAARIRPLRRFILDSRARTPLTAKVVSDEFAAQTTICVTEAASKGAVQALGQRVRVEVAPQRDGRVDVEWLVRRLGNEEITSLLVEGGGEVHASFLEAGLAQRVAFFYAPLVLGGGARPAVGGKGFSSIKTAPRLSQIHWKQLGPDLMLRALVDGS